MGLFRKTIILRVHHAFRYISFPSLHDYDEIMPIFTFCAERELRYSLLEFNSRKNCQHLRNWTRWNKHENVLGSATSLFKWRFSSCRRRCCLKPGFHMSGKSQTEIFLFPDCPRFCRRISENSKSQISPIVWDGRGQIWKIGSVSIFRMRPRFLRWSEMIPDKRELKFAPSGTSAMDVAHYQSPTLLGSSPLSHINMASLGQTCGDYPIHERV